ncbi:MAG: hypothetical protein MR815_01700 [Oscillospiraceae bacterium]|nr:hypothetical protein [Oscillospiraceae bacterium]
MSSNFYNFCVQFLHADAKAAIAEKFFAMAILLFLGHTRLENAAFSEKKTLLFDG